MAQRGSKTTGKTTKRASGTSRSTAASRSKTGTSKRSTSKARSKTSVSKTAQRKAKRAPKSKHFEQAKTRAGRLLSDPKATKKLLDSAESKMKKPSRLDEVADELKALLRLVRFYIAGDYRAIPWESLVLIVAGIIYVVSPVDAIPDVLAPIGLIDDAAVVVFVMGVVEEEVEDFMEWEKTQGS